MTPDSHSLEIHVGLPAGSRAPREAGRLFAWKQVVASCSGPGADALDGHHVDGTLFAIGTARVGTLDQASRLVEALQNEVWPEGVRLEVEIALSEPLSRSEYEASRVLTETLSTRWDPVPAPRYEGHVKVASDLVGSTSPQGPLLEIPYFEFTAFQGRDTSVVTFAGETLDEVVRNQERLCQAVSQHGGSVTGAVLEEVLGAWRPTSPRRSPT